MLKPWSFIVSTATLALVASAAPGQFGPLSYDTVGASPHTVTPPGSYAFSADGDVNLGGSIFKEGKPFVHNDGGFLAYNTAVGLDALVKSTLGDPDPISGTRNTALGSLALQRNTSGYFNVAAGVSALRNNTTGLFNTATGALALYSNTTGKGNTANGFKALFENITGYYNTASGPLALGYNTTGSYNTAIGPLALGYNTTGRRNTAFGFEALVFNTTGSRNIALGYRSGFSNMTGSDNIWIGTYGLNESNTLRIGSGTGTYYSQLNRAFISGIRDALGAQGGQDVCVNGTTDQLGPCSVSSARFKEDIADLDADSEAVFDLRPVRFRYKLEFVGEGEERPIRYGLIAEEVAQVYPQLVTYDAEGEPMTVRYEALAPLMLNELKKLRERNARQEAEIERLRALELDVAALRSGRALVEELAARLARLEAEQASREPPSRIARR